MNGALGADRVPEQQMVLDDGGGASQSDTLLGAEAALDANAARNDTRTSETPMDPMDVAVTTTVVSRSDGEAGPSVALVTMPSPAQGCRACNSKSKNYTHTCPLKRNAASITLTPIRSKRDRLPTQQLLSLTSKPSAAAEALALTTSADAPGTSSAVAPNVPVTLGAGDDAMIVAADEPSTNASFAFRRLLGRMRRLDADASGDEFEYELEGNDGTKRVCSFNEARDLPLRIKDEEENAWSCQCCSEKDWSFESARRFASGVARHRLRASSKWRRPRRPLGPRWLRIVCIPSACARSRSGNRRCGQSGGLEAHMQAKRR